MKNGINGYTYPPRNAFALAETIKEMVANEAERKCAQAAMWANWSHLGMLDRLMEIVRGSTPASAAV